MSPFGNKPEKEPVALPSRDGSADVELVRGARVARRPIFQSARSVDGWATEMVNRIAAAKVLGFTMFKIDVTGVKVSPPPEAAYGISAMFLGVSRHPVEGDEWKEDANRRLVNSQVITVYALVVE